jgi:1,2-diacylglycerol 3-alpha-glucosyltransferase
MSLRIAMVGAFPYPVPQGSQVFLRENALALQARDHDVHLLVYGYGLGRDYSGLKVHRCMRIPFTRRTAAGPSPAKPLLDLAMLFALRRLVRQYNIDAVFAHNYEALLIALAAGKRPIIYHAHNAMSDELPYYFQHKKIPERVGRWLDRHFPRRANRVLVPHRRLAGHLIVRGCDHTKVVIVPPPCNAYLFEPSETGQEKPPVLYTGNLDSYQNLGLLFAAMGLVRKERPDARLIVATADQAEIPGAELLTIPGFDALKGALAQDAIVAVPRVSWSGYPIKLLNAMAAGKAIVACESSAYPLTHEHDGLIVPDNDAPAFAAALLRLMDDAKLRDALGKNARETVMTRHHPDLVGEALELIVRELIQISE